MTSHPIAIPLGVNIALIVDQRVLLTRREDFEVWCLPGGAVDPGESLVEAAIREMREETGLEVEITHLIGLYSRPNFGGYHSLASFGARIIGGSLAPDPHEVIEVGYFGMDDLPEDLLLDHHERVSDALAGYGGSVVRSTPRTRPLEWPTDRRDLYAARDQSGLTRLAFYRQLNSQFGPLDSKLEVGGVKHDS